MGIVAIHATLVRQEVVVWSAALVCPVALWRLHLMNIH